MANRIREEVSKRCACSKHFLNDDGSYTAEIGAGAIHYEHAAGDWRDIDNTLILSDDENYEYMCVTTDIPIYVKRRIAGLTENIKITKGGVTIKVKSGSALKMVDSAGAKVESVLESVSPQLDDVLQNRVSFPGVHLQDTKTLDIDYHVHAGKIHEEFVCAEDIGFPEITQEVELSGGYAVRDGKQIVIRSSTTGEIVLTIPAPVMFEQGKPDDGNHDLDYVITGSLDGTFTITKVLEAAGKDWFFSPDRTYPLVVDTDFTALGTALAAINGSDMSYATARSTAAYYTVNGNDVNVGQYKSPPYSVDRGYLKFDTSSISSSAIISAVTMTLTAVADLSYTDFDLQIVDYDWSSYDPITGQEAAYDGCLSATLDNVWINTSGISTNTPYTSSALSTSWINKGGSTYYGLRSNRDYDNVAPTTYEFVAIYGWPVTTAWRPKLNVTYTLTSAPTVTTSSVTNPATSSGTGNGNITATGGANATVRGFCYKIGNSGDPTTADSTAYDSGDFGTGAYTKNIAGLIPGTSYRVRAYATNSAGTGYGSTVSYVALPTGAGLLMLLAK